MKRRCVKSAKPHSPTGEHIVIEITLQDLLLHEARGPAHLNTIYQNRKKGSRFSSSSVLKSDLLKTDPLQMKLDPYKSWQKSNLKRHWSNYIFALYMVTKPRHNI